MCNFWLRLEHLIPFWGLIYEKLSVWIGCNKKLNPPAHSRSECTNSQKNTPNFVNCKKILNFVILIHCKSSLRKWRNWQTHHLEGVAFYERGGSSPPFRTIFIHILTEIWILIFHNYKILV